MHNILIIGAGLSSSALIHYVLKNAEIKVILLFNFFSPKLYYYKKKFFPLANLKSNKLSQIDRK